MIECRWISHLLSAAGKEHQLPGERAYATPRYCSPRMSLAIMITATAYSVVAKARTPGSPPQEHEMGLFSRKQTVRLGTFCADFYDKNILSPVVEGVDIGRAYFETVMRSVMEADQALAAVDVDRFVFEMTLVRFEAFGLAWLHELGDKHAAAQSAYTKTYLEERGRESIWTSLEPYNQAIARSSTMGHTLETHTGRAYLTFVDRMRADPFDQWHGQGLDPEAVARDAKRISTNVAWDKGITAAFLMWTLCERLGCELNEEAQFRLITAIRGLYAGARQALRRVKVEA